MLVCQAETRFGSVCMAVVCDGMGGLRRGELAGSTVVTEMAGWFEHSLPDILYHHFSVSEIKISLRQLVSGVNRRIQVYGERQGIKLGTTMTALLLVGDTYYICNIGDSRIYYLEDGIKLLTRDQSYVQRQVDLGRMTANEALHSSDRNILLQCIGGEGEAFPDFYVGEYREKSGFLLCSDGFWHELYEEELRTGLRPEDFRAREDIEDRLLSMIGMVKDRGETDNITGAYVCVKAKQREGGKDTDGRQEDYFHISEIRRVMPVDDTI